MIGISFEQPDHSWLFYEQPWPVVMSLPTTVQLTVHQCSMGLRTKGLLAKKPTMLVSNSPILLKHFQDRKCNGRHEHGLLIGGRAAAAQVWTWDFANRVVQGIIDLKKHLAKVDYLYPTVGTGPSDPDLPDQAPKKWSCYGCRNRLSMYDPRHTRVQGECMRTGITTIEYRCPLFSS